MNLERVLVLAPHTDDAELGAGATIARLTSSGARVHVVAFSRCEESLPPGSPADTLEREFRSAMPELGVPETELTVHRLPVRRLAEHRQTILEELVRVRSVLRPTTVLLPSKHDLHQDHSVVYQEGIRAFRGSSILGYELPWNTLSFDVQAVFSVREEHVEAKCRALHAYASQVEKGRSYMDHGFIRGWARFRGVQAGVVFAEVFEVIRSRWDMSGD